jgi:hypothetical protein
VALCRADLTRRREVAEVDALGGPVCPYQVIAPEQGTIVGVGEVRRCVESVGHVAGDQKGRCQARKLKVGGYNRGRAYVGVARPRTARGKAALCNLLEVACVIEYILCCD